MKILAKVFLFSGLVFLPAIGCAQDNYFVPQKDCGSLLTLGNTTVVQELADKQDCMNGNQIQLKTSVENLRFRVSNNEADILTLQDKIKQTELEARIETLEARLHLIERRLDMAEEEIEWLTPKTPARKPKASGLIPRKDSK
jgi:chromosome segregation ATPase